jgi:hypothetical protein
MGKVAGEKKVGRRAKLAQEERRWSEVTESKWPENEAARERKWPAKERIGCHCWILRSPKWTLIELSVGMLRARRIWMSSTE